MSASSIASDDCPRIRGMPALGFGTWKLTDPEVCERAVKTALETGYRHIDTAQRYDNERAVGAGIDAASVDRDEVFLATKIWHTDLAYDDVVEAARESLDRLAVDHVDLLYVHWPATAYDPEETLAAFADLLADGVTERIGVSNFTPELLETAVDACPAPIFANQVEMHPLLQQREVRSACAANDIEVVAYSPLVRGEILDVPAISEIAAKHDATEPQIGLAWLREKGVAAIPKATSRQHIRENWASLAVELDASDIERIDDIAETRRLATPSFAPW